MVLLAEFGFDGNRIFFAERIADQPFPAPVDCFDGRRHDRSGFRAFGFGERIGRRRKPDRFFGRRGQLARFKRNFETHPQLRPHDFAAIVYEVILDLIASGPGWDAEWDDEVDGRSGRDGELPCVPGRQLQLDQLGRLKENSALPLRRVERERIDADETRQFILAWYHL